MRKEKAKHQCHLEQAHHAEKLKTGLTNRLSRIEGQIRGVARMISDDIYCDDVLNQIRSIEAAINGVKVELLNAHLKSCVAQQLREGKDEVIDELTATIGRLMR